MGGASGGEEQAYQINDENVEAVLVASNYLEVQSVQTACCKHLQCRIACDTCWTTLATAVRFGCDPLCADAMEYIQRMFEQQDTLPDHTALQALSKDVMLELLHSPALQFGSECELFQAVLIWIAGDAAARLADLSALLTAVRPPVSKDADCREDIKTAGGVAALLGQLRDDSMDLRDNAAGALGSLSARSSDVQDAIREAGGIPAVSGGPARARAGARLPVGSGTGGDGSGLGGLLPGTHNK
ncbi:hypothetical protein WJX72_008338 [[Myrmecia] bisecta]|uniref:BACK domain-containing protein n=1 Tax=[Myrmecia] bisecta TaxID=41462 RepID=A0AAW1QAY4_9CHLO